VTVAQRSLIWDLPEQTCSTKRKISEITSSFCGAPYYAPGHFYSGRNNLDKLPWLRCEYRKTPTCIAQLYSCDGSGKEQRCFQRSNFEENLTAPARPYGGLSHPS